jgi:membrane protein DedA with SNARE-associated domain
MHEWIIANGEWGVASLMLLQNVFPILPSEFIMPLAGFLVSRGYLQLHTTILAGLFGSMLGDLPWYFLGFALGEERIKAFVAKYGKWIRLRSVHIQKAGDWFDRNSAKALLLGRLVPGLRTCINIPAGVSHMPFLPFLAYTFIGEAVWTSFLTLGGYLLGRDYLMLAQYIHLASLGALAITGLFFFLIYLRRRARARVTRPKDHAAGSGSKKRPGGIFKGLGGGFASSSEEALSCRDA